MFVTKYLGLHIPKHIVERKIQTFYDQYPCLNPPSKITHSNFNMDPINMEKLKKTWVLGYCVASDEYTRGFQSKDFKKFVIKYKRYGDEYLIN